MISRSFWSIGFRSCLILVTWLSLAPLEQLPEFNLWDKANHAIAFFVLAGLARLAFLNPTLLALFIMLMLYGLLTEIAQGFLPFRHFSLLDLLADAIGALPGLFIASRTRNFLTSDKD